MPQLQTSVSRNSKNRCPHHIRTEFLMYDSQSLHCLRYMISPLHVVQPELSPKPSSPPFHKSAPSNQSVVCQYKLGSVVELDPIISRIKPPTVLGSHKLFWDMDKYIFYSVLPNRISGPHYSQDQTTNCIRYTQVILRHGQIYQIYVCISCLLSKNSIDMFFFWYVFV